MADGQAPDITQALLQMQSLLNSQRSNSGGGAPIIAALLPGGGRDIDVGAGLSSKGKGLNADGMMNKLPQAKPGLLASLKQQMGLTGGQVFDDIKKCAQGAGVMYTGDLPTGTPVNSGGMQGSSFADNIGPRSSGGMDIG
jgi:hypothetical protein